jgi:hypothetical protein
MDVHYFPLLPLFTVVMDQLLHHYCFITTHDRTLLPLLTITYISLLLITTTRVVITAYYLGR